MRGGGFFLEPLNYLAKKLNFTLKLMASVDGKWGSRNGDDGTTWNGMIGMVVNGTADIAAAALTRTMERDKVTSFSITLMEELSTLAAPVSTTPATHVWVYMDIFPNIIWAICGIMLFTIAVSFTVINASGVNRLHYPTDSEQFDIINGIGVTMLFFLQLSYNVCTKSLSSRILFLLTGMGTYVIFSYYTADLTARMTSGPGKSAIKSFSDAFEGEYTIITKEATATHEFMKTAMSGTAMHKVYYETMDGNPNSFVKNLNEALGVMYSSEKTLFFTSSLNGFLTDRLTFLDLQVHFTFVFSSYRFHTLCKLELWYDLQDSINAPLGWAFQKNSELVECFNYNLQKMDEVGILSFLLHKTKTKYSEEFREVHMYVL